jgi:hypothetical protein
MTRELNQFRRELKKVEHLQFALVYSDKYEEELKSQLHQASKDKSSSYFGMTFNELRADLLEAFMVAEIVLLRRAVEHYTSTVHKGNDWKGQTDMKRRCPTYKIKYHLDYPEVHVIDLSYELRNLIVHPLKSDSTKFMETTVLSPLDVLKQEATLLTNAESRREILVLRGSDNRQRYLSRIQKMDVGRWHHRFDLFSGILFEEVRDCVGTYDSVRSLSTDKAIRESTSRHQPMEYG